MVLDRVNRLLERAGRPVMIHRPENVRYLSGFTGEGVLVAGGGARILVTDFRYVEAAQRESPQWQLRMSDAAHPEDQLAAQAVKELGDQALWEEDFLTLRQADALRAQLAGVKLDALGALVSDLRCVKDAGEIEGMAQAARITDEAFAHICAFIKEGQTEREIALELYVEMMRRGAQDLSFPSIVASGPNASLPHAVPGERRVRAGDVITMDFGCKVNDYCSDFTRTVALGKLEGELQKVYGIVLDANLLALDALCAGKKGCEVDAVARSYIASKGYGPMFGHSLGHGVGRMIHEEPRLSVSSQTVLAPGMAVTIEPGIYLPGTGGVRIEDLCIVEDGGHRNLCASDKKLIVL